MAKMLEFSGPTDGALEDEDPHYPSDEMIRRALSGTSEKLRAVLKQEEEEAQREEENQINAQGDPVVRAIFEDLD
jgi:hypothetical protein